MPGEVHPDPQHRQVPLIVLSGLGYVLGIAFLALIGASSPREGLRYILRTPEVAVWSVLVAAQIGLAAGLFFPLLRRLRDYLKYVSKMRLELVLSAGMIVLLFGLFILSHFVVGRPSVLPVRYQFPKVMVITAIGFFVLCLALAGMSLVGRAAKELFAETSGTSELVLRFLKLRDDLQWFLLAAGLIIGGATLTTGALNRALTVLNPGYQFNPAIVLLYGAYGSGIISLIYIPASISLRNAGNKLCAMSLGTPPDSVTEVIAWHEQNSKLQELLQLKGDSLIGLKTGLAILTPLAGSALSLFLKS